MNRTDFQQLAEIRLRESQALLDASCFDGAYYLAGYAVECALKACFARQTQQYDYPDRDLVNKMWQHNLERLLEVAVQKGDRDALTAHPQRQLNWAIVKDWSEHSRYTRTAEGAARELIEAISHPESGILTWLRSIW